MLVTEYNEEETMELFKEDGRKVSQRKGYSFIQKD